MLWKLSIKIKSLSLILFLSGTHFVLSKRTFFQEFLYLKLVVKVIDKFSRVVPFVKVVLIFLIPAVLDCSFNNINFSISNLESLMKCELTHPQSEAADILAQVFLVVPFTLS